MRFPAVKVQVRHMSIADLEQVIVVAGSLKDVPHWPRTVYLDALDPAGSPRRIALVAADAATGAVTGFVVASLVAPQSELETIAVAAPSQRHGVGRSLLAALAEQLRLAGIQEVTLEVRASNQAARGLYRALGFNETGLRRLYYADPVEDAVLMELRLSE
jgi:ribosomal-protein-alanine N-acetyltransferase